MTIDPAVWSDDAGQVLAAAVSHASVEDIRRQVEAGAALFQVTAKGAVVGYYVLRVDKLSAGCEGVLVAAAGRIPGVDLTAALVPVIERQFIGCVSMRVHTNRPGLVKKLAAQGYGGAEIVVRKRLNGTN